jgi:hydrogenase maturation protease
MNRMLVIGIGSLIMTDDSIGVRVADAIRAKLQAQDIAVVIGETDVQFCLGEILPDDRLIIIDAMMQGVEPGEIAVMPLHDALKGHGRLHSQHDMSLMDALSLTYPDMQGCFIGIEASEIGFGFDLSNELQNRFDQICLDVFSAILDMREAASRA